MRMLSVVNAPRLQIRHPEDAGQELWKKRNTYHDTVTPSFSYKLVKIEMCTDLMPFDYQQDVQLAACSAVARLGSGQPARPRFDSKGSEFVSGLTSIHTSCHNDSSHKRVGVWLYFLLV